MRKISKTNRHSGKQSASRINKRSWTSQDDNSQEGLNRNSYQRIYEIVKKIPLGKVMTYKQVSILANVATPRVVGFALHVNKDPKHIPCHRVVFSNGKLTSGYAFGGEGVQKEKLEKEGIQFNAKGEVILEKYLANSSS